MFRIIRAELFRFRHEAVFWAAAVICPLAGEWFGLDSALKYSMQKTPNLMMNEVVFWIIMAIPMVLHFTRDNYDGTIRNKIVVGTSRGVILGGRMVTAFIVSAVLFGLYFGAYLISARASGTELFGIIPKNVRLWMLPGLLLHSWFWAMAIVLVSSLTSIKAAGEIISISAVCLLFYLSAFVSNQLDIPKYDSSSKFAEIEMTQEEYEANPVGDIVGRIEGSGMETVYFVRIALPEDKWQQNVMYVEQPLRTVYRVADYALPTGQMINYCKCWQNSAEAKRNPSRHDALYRGEELSVGCLKAYPFCSAAAIAVLAGAAAFFMKRKDFK